MLPAEAFVRAHKSWIVAKRCVRSLDGNLLLLDKFKIPVSREQKEVVVRAMF
jgi:DNA-binding LytR/AlgR family response regulator